MSDWQTKLLNHWREESGKSSHQREKEKQEAHAREEAEREAADELFYAKYPHLRPTAERLASLKAGKCAHCSKFYREWEHVEHFYCSIACARVASTA
jgi:hypothetical protein